MRHLRQRNLKIITEIMNYLLKIGCEKIHLDYFVEHDNLNINFSCLVENLDEKSISNMKTLLSIPRRYDMEEYYWELTGDDDLDTELSLVGMMVDHADIYYTNNNLKIHLKRLI